MLRSPGPAPAFDRDAVLATVLGLFWERGYAEVSLADILAATGLARQSFYNTFGSKAAAFTEAVDRYVAEHQRPLLELLDAPGSPRENVRSFLAVWEGNAAGKECGEQPAAQAGSPQGCLLVNLCDDVASLPPEAVEVVTAAVARFETRLGKAITRAIKAGEVETAYTGPKLARLLAALGNGLMLAARNPVDGRSAKGVLVGAFDSLAPGVAAR